MAKGICSTDGCERELLAQGFCSKHYQRFRAAGGSTVVKRPCSVEGCAATSTKRDWCKKHWRIVQAHGSLESPHRPKPDQSWMNAIEVPQGATAVPVMISLNEGFTYAVVDAADYDDVIKWRWSLTGNGYAGRHTQATRIYMHRELMQTPDGMDTDHINRDKLDNRRSNLRITDRTQNNYNTPPSRANTSGHKGVGYFKPAKLWRAYIGNKSQGKRIELGYFKTKEEAIAARKAAEAIYVDECA